MRSLLVSAVDGLFDDASLFPPARRSMAHALDAHAHTRAGPLAQFIGPFLCPVSRLDELDACVAGGRPRPPELGVIAYDVGRPVPRLAARPGIVQIEAPLGTRLPQLGGRVRCYLEVPHHTDAAAALDAVAAAGAAAKVRCGGPGREHVPSCFRLADILVGCAERGLQLKATAGLHHPFFRRTGPVTGEHGFVNLLAAAAEAYDGGPRAAVAGLLAVEEPEARELVDRVGHARRLLSSVGTCSVDEPLQALRERGLL